MAGPLNGLRVLDFSRILAGPWAAQTMADLGAEVIKIERRGSGDDTRQWGPPFIADGDGREIPDAAYFHCANRGKKSLTLDLASAKGQEIVRRLVATSDILVENYKRGGLARYRLGYEDLRAVNPGLIYCSITGFGQTGPYADRAGYDFLIQAMGGLMSITGERDDLPGGGPQKVGVAVTDVLTGSLHRDRGAGRAARARADRPGQACRHGAVRRGGRRDRQPGDELPRLRRGAGTDGQRASQRGALPVVCDRRPPCRGRGRQRLPVRAVLRGGRAARACRGRTVPPPMPGGSSIATR